MRPEKPSSPAAPASAAWEPGPEARRRILRDRALALARRPPSTEPTGGEIEILEFQLAHERYGVESSYVREVYPLKDLTPLPCRSAFVLGIVNVRGQIVSVLDIRKFFDLPERGLTDLNKVIILHGPSMEFGILGDSIHGMRRIALQEIQPSLPTFTGIRERYLKGVTRDRLVVLDAGKLLEDENIVVREEAEV